MGISRMLPAMNSVFAANPNLPAITPKCTPYLRQEKAAEGARDEYCRYEVAS
jgi:hypothetical protein